MPTITMNISLPDTLKSAVDQRVADRGYASHSEYVRDMVQREELEPAKDQMRALIAAGLNSPTGNPWAELRRDLLQRTKSSAAK